MKTLTILLVLIAGQVFGQDTLLHLNFENGIHKPILVIDKRDTIVIDSSHCGWLKAHGLPGYIGVCDTTFMIIDGKIYHSPGADIYFRGGETPSLEWKIQQYIADYEEYEAECWADSLHYATTYEYNEDCDCHKGTKLYSHPTIPTFHGFMEFLKRKYNQN